MLSPQKLAILEVTSLAWQTDFRSAGSEYWLIAPRRQPGGEATANCARAKKVAAKTVLASMLAVLVGFSGGLGWWFVWAGSLRSEVGCSESERVKMISLRSDKNERSLESEDCGGLAGGWVHESDETRRDRGPLSPCQEGSRNP